MKKTLALVLALLMVLALAPTAFATATTSASSNDLKVEVTVTIDEKDIESIEICEANGWESNQNTEHPEWTKTFTATGKNPTVNVEVPYGMIDELHGEGIWDSDVLDVKVKVSGLHYSWNKDAYDDGITVTLDGKDVTEDIWFDEPDDFDDEDLAAAEAKWQEINYALTTNQKKLEGVTSYQERILSTYASRIKNHYPEFDTAPYANDKVNAQNYAELHAALVKEYSKYIELNNETLEEARAEHAASGKVHSFTCNADLHQKSASYKYEFVLTGDKDDVTYKEYVNFTLSYTDTTKPVYDLKFGQPDTDGVELKDGVYFIDSAFYWYADENTAKGGHIAQKYDLTDITSATINVFKNDGSKFTERAYYEINGYPVYVQNDKDATSRKVSDSQVTIYDPANNDNGNNKELRNMEGAKQSFDVIVETEYAIYKGTVNIKYRKNVSRVDPKGVFFDKDEYTIGVNEVFTPSYTTTVPVYHDVASYIDLSISANTEKNVVDVDDGTIIGLKEGTAYVVLNYRDVFVRADGAEGNWVYTDTVKVTVKGTYQVTDKANYIVTTSSSNLNVRSGAGTKYSKIGSLAKGTVVEVVEIKDGWAKIIYPSARYTNGYVSAQYLTKQSTSPETVIGEKTVIARVLNVRSGAGTSYSIVGKLIRNTKVEVIETVANGSWSKIKFGGGYAYVSSTYIQ